MTKGAIVYDMHKEQRSHTQTDGVNHDIVSSKLRCEIVY
jgi:hypothetical protein